LSGLRDELTLQLGRRPTGDENALHVYRVYQDQTPLGNVLTARVKAEHGALEVAVATTLDGAVQGVRVQRLREPSPVAVALQDPKWLASFTGHRAGDEFKIGKDIGDISPEARVSAMALTQGVRDLLILLAAADKAVPVSHHGPNSLLKKSRAPREGTRPTMNSLRIAGFYSPGAARRKSASQSFHGRMPPNAPVFSTRRAALIRPRLRSRLFAGGAPQN
jgi:hypothetical protein